MGDINDPRPTLAWRGIPRLGGRFIRVVYHPLGSDVVIVTVFLDRGAGRRFQDT